MDDHEVTGDRLCDDARAQAMYKLVADEASDIILLYDARGNILFASNALQRLMKRDVEEIEHRKFLDLIHPDDLEAGRKLAVRPLPGEILTASYRVRHGDGHYVWIEATTRGIYDEDDGTLKSVISVSRDITVRKTHELEMQAARERAEAANKAKSSFLANMSHELRTPLNAIIGFTDLMRQAMFGPLGSPRYEEYATVIYDSGQLLLDLISDMLDMAKIEAGKLELNFEGVDLSGTIADCVRLLQDRADNNGVEMLVEPMGPISFTADRRAVKQVLLNLLSNAVKFTPAGGHVTVRAEKRGESVWVTVCDTGVGIPESDIARLGNPFEQARTNPMLAQAGTGLGLALVRALAQQHGGGLHISSQEGIGTEVSVDFLVTPPVRRAVAA
jgi:PAS domain S-box-containing protein